MTDDERRSLAEAQARLVRALGAQQAPEGFDRARFEQAARSLMNKRRRGIEKAWPALAARIEERFAELFARYAQATSFPAEGSHAADAAGLAAFLVGCADLPVDLRLDLLRMIVPRRPVRIVRLAGTGLTVVCLNLPLVGRRTLCVGCRRRR